MSGGKPLSLVESSGFLGLCDQFPLYLQSRDKCAPVSVSTASFNFRVSRGTWVEGMSPPTGSLRPRLVHDLTWHFLPELSNGKGIERRGQGKRVSKGYLSALALLEKSATRGTADFDKSYFGPMGLVLSYR